MSSASGFTAADAPIRVLLVEQNRRDTVCVRYMLPRGPSQGPFLVEPVERIEDALQHLQLGSFDVFLLDLDAQDGHGVDSLMRAHGAAESVPIVVMSDEEDETLATRALRLGAQDYIAKSLASRQLVTRTLLHAVERHRLLRERSDSFRREHFLATHDALTELPNRLSLMDFMRCALALAERRKSSVGVVFVDLDGFKQVNDTCGHADGDALLHEVAQRLSGKIRRSDMVARIGGDEFVVALQDVNGRDGAICSAAKLATELAKPFHIAGKEHTVTASFGIANYPDHANDPEELIANADAAMYDAKRHGRNQIRIYRGPGAEGPEPSESDG